MFTLDPACGMLRLVQPPGDITLLLDRLREGRQEALDQLIPVVYRDLRRLADGHLRRQGPGHTLQPTALVHEVFLRFAETENATWRDREHFFASASRIMRNLLVDHARAKGRQKRGAGERALPLADAPDVALPGPEDVLLLDDALRRFAELDPRASRVVEMRCFLGLGLSEIAEALGVNERTVRRDWTMAKAWLGRELRIRTEEA